ncbi:hypothetical protein [Bradyrhizobium sp. 2]|uniref:hypothetical protein n=1 Tax=unclassified Bradyrhizobium TaxID=2631580 RepID=UPI001FF9E0CA|nr:hypothetical protein [Bradyrhizobium sp. 2]MCK1462971.1 hypothetical protein [Bradyrhizobium sp. 2]
MRIPFAGLAVSSAATIALVAFVVSISHQWSEIVFSLLSVLIWGLALFDPSA